MSEFLCSVCGYEFTSDAVAINRMCPRCKSEGNQHGPTIFEESTEIDYSDYTQDPLVHNSIDEI